MYHPIVWCLEHMCVCVCVCSITVLYCTALRRLAVAYWGNTLESFHHGCDFKLVATGFGIAAPILFPIIIYHLITATRKKIELNCYLLVGWG